MPHQYDFTEREKAAAKEEEERTRAELRGLSYIRGDRKGLTLREAQDLEGRMARFEGREFDPSRVEPVSASTEQHIEDQVRELATATREKRPMRKVKMDMDAVWEESEPSEDDIDMDSVWDEAGQADISRTVGGTIKDVGVTVAKSIVGAGEVAVGLANIPTLGRTGKAMKDYLGYDPEKTQEFLSSFYSPAQKEAAKKVEEAKGFVGTAKEMIKHPSTIGHAVIESAPMMLGGVAAARKLLSVSILKMTPAWNNIIAAAMGEGLVSAGASAEGIRQQTEDGLLTPKQSALSIVTGVGTGLFAVVGGSVAKKLGLADVDTFLAGGSSVTSAGVAKRIIGGGISEGAFEELGQSMQEQVWLNAALDKPLLEEVGEAGATGLLTGFAMGAGFNIFTGKPKTSEDEIGDTPVAEQPETEKGLEERKALTNMITEGMRTGKVMGEEFTKEDAIAAIQQAHTDQTITDDDIQVFKEQYPELKLELDKVVLSAEVKAEPLIEDQQDLSISGFTKTEDGKISFIPEYVEELKTIVTEITERGFQLFDRPQGFDVVAVNKDNIEQATKFIRENPEILNIIHKIEQDQEITQSEQKLITSLTISLPYQKVRDKQVATVLDKFTERKEKELTKKEKSAKLLETSNLLVEKYPDLFNLIQGLQYGEATEENIPKGLRGFKFSEDAIKELKNLPVGQGFELLSNVKDVVKVDEKKAQQQAEDFLKKFPDAVDMFKKIAEGQPLTAKDEDLLLLTGSAIGLPYTPRHEISNLDEYEAAKVTAIVAPQKEKPKTSIKPTVDEKQKAVEPTGITVPQEIPTFKKTEDALSFGKKATPEQTVELKRLWDEAGEKAKTLKGQERLDQSFVSQFYREAYEVAVKTQAKPEIPKVTGKEASAKEPYEMNKEDFTKHQKAHMGNPELLSWIKRKWEEEGSPEGRSGMSYVEQLDKYGIVDGERRATIEQALFEGKTVDPSIISEYPDLALAKPQAAQVDKEPWQMTAQEYRKTNPDGLTGDENLLAKRLGDKHENIVREAFETGKKVPNEVLRDYPNLATAKPQPAQLTKPKPLEAAGDTIEPKSIPMPTPKKPKAKIPSKLDLTKRYVEETGEKIQKGEINKVKEKYPEEWKVVEKKEKDKKNLWDKLPESLKRNRGINEYTVEELENIAEKPTITYRKSKKTHLIEATDPAGNVIGKARFVDKNGNIIYEPGGILYVEPEHRRQGIATELYKKAEEITGKKIIASANLTGEGKFFQDKWFEPSQKKLFSTKANPAKTITRKKMREIFSKMQNVSTGINKAGNLYFKVKGKPAVEILEVDFIEGYVDSQKAADKKSEALYKLLNCLD